MGSSISDATVRACVIELERRLTDHRVFESHVDQSRVIAVVPVVSKSVVLENATRFVEASRAFRDRAAALTKALADHLGLEEIRELSRLGLGERVAGQLNAEWRYQLHGFESRFTNSKTGQVLDVQLEFGAERGALDPYFFYEFLKSTPEFCDLAALLADGFHDTAQVLEVLVASGFLAEVRSPITGQSAPVARVDILS
jgi:hypothetical protein